MDFVVRVGKNISCENFCATASKASARRLNKSTWMDAESHGNIEESIFLLGKKINETQQQYSHIKVLFSFVPASKLSFQTEKLC